MRGRCCVAAAAPFDQHAIAQVAISVSMDEARFEEAGDAIVALLLEARDQVAREAHGRAALGASSSLGVVIGGPS